MMSSGAKRRGGGALTSPTGPRDRRRSVTVPSLNSSLSSLSHPHSSMIPHSTVYSSLSHLSVIPGVHRKGVTSTVGDPALATVADAGGGDGGLKRGHAIAPSHASPVNLIVPGWVPPSQRGGRTRFRGCRHAAPANRGAPGVLERLCRYQEARESRDCTGD